MKGHSACDFVHLPAVYKVQTFSDPLIVVETLVNSHLENLKGQNVRAIVQLRRLYLCLFALPLLFPFDLPLPTPFGSSGWLCEQVA